MTSPAAFPTSPDERNAIGVLGGLGPYAGLDLVRAIFDETVASTDQEHLPVALISYPGRFPDRSAWIANPEENPSPVPAMVEVLRRLDLAGCSVVGIPCNTAHAPALFDQLIEAMTIEGRRLRILHIVDAIVSAIKYRVPNVKTVGVLATTSSIENRLHEVGLEREGYKAVAPSRDVQELVQASIFDTDWGLKAKSAPPTEKARSVLLEAIRHLADKGADAVILGCTELPLAVPEMQYEGTPLINSTRALARALISATHPEKLAPFA
ncbi:MAG: amino acid racemase [Rubricoccaceae bacterium]|nr:amino acid racemase [Rubricoccaceae bacterium]